MDIESWLRELGLERYVEAFRNNEVTPEILHELTAEDLKEIGVAAVGHRRQLMSAIEVLGSGPQSNPRGSRAAPTADVQPAAAADSRTQQPSEGERRQLSVMFCDLVGSTALSAKLDPEDLREVIGTYHACVAAAVARFGGFVAELLGDGVLVYFGWPRGGEWDAEQAVNAGLDVVRAVSLLGGGAGSCRVRIGIATGLVIVGDTVQAGSARTQAAVGQTPNLAARLQSLAEPDTIVIDRATHDRIGALFVCDALPEVELKGFAKPVRAWRVGGTRAVESRVEALRGGAAAGPLIGRDEEIDLLLRRWQQACEGTGRVVLISGEPGIGKSRLTAELEARLSRTAHHRLRYFCSAQRQNSALHPVIGQVEHAAGFAREDTTDARLRKLRDLISPSRPSPEDLAILADLMSIRTKELAVLNVSPQRRKEMTFGALNRWLEQRARHRPVLILLEDGHWADPTTLELFDRMVNRVRHLPVLFVITFRPEFQPPWIGRSGVALLAMSRLDPEHATEMVAQVTAGAMSSALVQRIAGQADGVPLFIEELTRTVLERGLDSLGDAPLAVPETLQASLMARLDRFPAAKQVAQIGSVVGREFREDLLAAIATIPPQVQREGLAQLVASGLVFCRGEPPDALYIFKHALVQDTAYESLLKSRRATIHGSIVRGLLQLVPDVEAKQPDVLGHHCALAGLTENAVAYFLQAAQRAAERSAMSEAQAHLRRGLALAAAIGDGAERRLRQAELHLVLANVHTAVHGYASAERGEALAQAAALCRTLDPKMPRTAELIARVLHGNWSKKIHGGELRESGHLAKEFLEFSRSFEQRETQIIALISNGMNCAIDGHVVEATEMFDIASRTCLQVSDGSSMQFGTDLRVLLLAQSSRAFACFGYLDEAARRASEALRCAELLKHLPSLATVLAATSDAAWFLRDVHALRERAAALVALAGEQRFQFWLARGQCYAGWVAGSEGRAAEGGRLIREGLTGLERAGVLLYRPHTLAMLSDTEAWAGAKESAVDLLDQAINVTLNTGEVWCAAELHRRKGQLLLDDPPSAELHLRTALEIARNGSYKLWELRAATGLARLWLRQDKIVEARELLSPMYASFTEGFSAPDLRDAAAVLTEV
jgi:predicted ATPase/class 3 adenylate cyclase